MSRKLFCWILFILVALVMPTSAAVVPVTSVTITRVDEPGGMVHFWLESITVGDYTVSVNRLVTGMSEGVATAQPAPYNDITAADNFDLNHFAGRATENPPTHTITQFGGKGAWTDTNGDNPDFFVFETGGNQDIGIAAVLPGGTIGNTVSVSQTLFGDTGLVITTSGPHNGQTIEGIAFAVTDLLDQNGNNLTNTSVIEGIQVQSEGYDPSLVCAVLAGKIYIATVPSPADGALHTDTWVNLSWMPGDAAVSHNIYIGESFDDVNNATIDSPEFQGNQTASFIVAGFPGFPYPEGLIPGTTYYWRIDEVNDAEPASPWKGDVWSFSIPPNTAYNPNPADGAEFVALDATFSWTAGHGAKLHTVYLGDSFDDVSNAAGGAPQGVVTYKPASLQSEKVYYWRVDEFDGFVTHKGDIWGFTTPDAAGSLQPANGAVGVQINSTLNWTPAANAVSHDIYFGTDKDAVKNATTASPEFKGNKAKGSESYDPGKLTWDSEYYWRVDAVYNSGPVKGLVWSFATADFLLVDDFESYNDIDPPDPASNRIFDSWIDGFGTTNNGALVGNDLPPYAEQTIIHGGAQSMPYFYDNNQKTSEATLTLVYPRDWTEEGVARLSLWFRGDSGNAAERMYVALNGSAVVYHDDAAVTQIGQWTRWVMELQAFADQGVNLANVNTLTIGLGTKNSPAAGGAGTMYFDDIQLYR